MKRRLTTLVVVLALLATSGLAVPTADAAHRDPVSGRYQAIDDVDGSNLLISVRGHHNPRLRLRDDGGSVCQDAGLGLVPARFAGPLVQTGLDSYVVTGDVDCRTRGGWVTVIPGLGLGFTYDPIGRTLTDSNGQIYFQR